MARQRGGDSHEAGRLIYQALRLSVQAGLLARAAQKALARSNAKVAVKATEGPKEEDRSSATT